MKNFDAAKSDNLKNSGESVGMLSVVYPIEIDYFLYFVRCKYV